MNYKEILKKENEEVRERFELVLSGIKSNIIEKEIEDKKSIIQEYCSESPKKN